MSTNKHLNHIAAILMLVVVVFTVVLCFNPDIFGIEAAATVGYEKYFDEDVVMTVEIITEDSEWQSMLTNAQSEEYIQCDVIINGERIDNVGIRAKGNSSLQQVASSDSDRYSFKIEFDQYVDNQTFYGLDKLVLNNTQADATYMKEYMSYEIFDSVGVVVPLHSYAQITVNGENGGCYLAIEAMEESFANRVYGLEYGQLYRPESMSMDGGVGGGFPISRDSEIDTSINPDANVKIEINADTYANNEVSVSGFSEGGFATGGKSLFGGRSSGGTNLVYTDDEISSYSSIFDSAAFDATEEDYERVVEALKNLNSGTELEKYIDVEATLRYFAAQTFIINFDSYYGSLQHNYYLYEEKGQLTMLPWDLNLAFGGFQSGDAASSINSPIDTPLSDVTMEERPMLSKLLEVPEYMEMYHEYLDEIVTDYVQSGEYSETIAKVDTLIHTYVETDATAFYTIDEYEAAVPTLLSFGLLRAESIVGQLQGTIPSTEDGQTLDASTLVDVGSLDLSVLGSQGGDGDFGKGSIDGNMGRRNWNNSSDSTDTTENAEIEETLPTAPEGFGEGDASNMPTAPEGWSEGEMPDGFSEGDMPTAPDGFPNGDATNMPEGMLRPNQGNITGVTDNATEENQATEGSISIIGIGLIGGISILGLLLVCLFKRRKYSL